MNIVLIWESFRPRQWIKNIFLFAGIVLSGKLFEPNLLYKAGLAFFIFCLLSGSVYIINDLVDRESDGSHPVKRRRPLASGRLKASSAIMAISILIPALLVSSYYLNQTFCLLAMTYLILQVAYSLWLKQQVILDILIIAAGFLISVIAGMVVIGVIIPPWIGVFAVLLALLFGLNKRQYELVFLKNNAEIHRKVLTKYGLCHLDRLIMLATLATVCSYILFAFSQSGTGGHDARYLIFTLPFVLYGLSRYLYLMHTRGFGEETEIILFKDRRLMLTVLLWLCAIIAIIYGRA